MLDDEHGVADLGELPAQLGETLGVARVEPDRGLVQDVERPHELGPELVGEVDALGFPPGEGARLPAQGEIAQADTLQEGQLGAQELEGLAPHGFLPRREAEAGEEGVKLLDRLAVPLGDGGAAHAHGQRLGLEAGARAARARRLAAVAGEEDPHVQLVPVGLDLLEESLDAREALPARVDPLSVGLGEVGIRSRHVDAALLGMLEELLLVPAARGM